MVDCPVCHEKGIAKELAENKIKDSGLIVNPDTIKASLMQTVVDDSPGTGEVTVILIDACSKCGVLYITDKVKISRTSLFVPSTGRQQTKFNAPGLQIKPPILRP